MSDAFTAARVTARGLIDSEVATQAKMWGSDNSRADCMGGELLQGAMSSQLLTLVKADPGFGGSPQEAENIAREMFYPKNWSGFRDYGDTYNLVVAAAFLENEIARRIANGDDYSRKPRAPEQAYKAETGLPIVSSAEARGEA